MTEGAREWDGSSESIPQATLKEISIEDLLPRDEIQVDMQSVGQEIAGTRRFDYRVCGQHWQRDGSANQFAEAGRIDAYRPSRDAATRHTPFDVARLRGH